MNTVVTITLILPFSETKGKCEALRMKKKLETDVCDLETALEHANAANAETQRSIKKYQQSLR